MKYFMRMKTPIILDNKNIRKDNKFIDKYFYETNRNLHKNVKKLLLNKKKITDNISCPSCNSRKKVHIYKINLFNYERCLACKTVYVSNPFKNSILIKKYKKSLGDKYYLKMMEKGYMKKYNELLFDKYIKIIKKKFNLNKGKIIDIGCGAGVFLNFVKKKYPEYRLFGSEYISDSYNKITKIIPKENFFFQKEINSFPKNKFDIIFLWGVLEHVRNPRKFLKDCKNILKQKGIVILLIPNFDSAARDILGVNTPTLNPLVHLNFFSIFGMKKINKYLNTKLHGPFLELPIIDLMYPYIKSIKLSIKNILQKNKSYYHVYIIEKKY